MATHYVRLLPLAVCTGLRDDNARRWAEEVFNDLTKGGHVLTTVPLPDDDKGRSILGLCGERFFGEVYQDDKRPDCLFVFRVWNAESRRPKVKSNHHKVATRIFPESGRISKLDSVGALFSPIPKKRSVKPLPTKRPKKRSVKPLPTKRPEERFVEPSPELRAVVQNLDLDSIRRLCTEAPKILDKGDWRGLLKRLRSLYLQFNKFNIPIKSLESRDKLILNGTITPPPHIDIELCKKIGEACDVRFFNRLGISNRHKKLLLDLLDLPVGTAVTRRILWLTWLSEQEPRTLEKELHVVANQLVSVDNESDSHLDDLLLKTLQKVGERYNDVSLLVLKRKAENSDAPWNVIADWASNFVAGETAPPRPDHKTDIPKGNSALKSATKPIKRERVKEPNQANAINGPETDTHLAPDRALPERSASPQSERDMLADWIIAQRLSSSEVADEITKPMQEAMQVLRGETIDTSSLKILRNALSDLQKTSAAALHLIPTLEEIDLVITESETLVAGLKRKLGRDPLPFLNQAVHLDALREVARSEPLLSTIGALPDWAVPPLSNGLPGDSTDRLLIKCLRENKFRQDMERLGEKLTHSDEDPRRLLESIPPPSPEFDTVNYLSDWVDRETKSASEVAQRLRHLTDRVSAEVAKAITEKVEAAADNESRLAALDEEELILEGLEKMLGHARTVTTRQWDHAQERIGVRSQVAVSPRDTVHPQKKFTIRHNYVDSEGRRAAATYVPYDDPDMPYGFVTVPLALESPIRVEADLDLELKVRTNQRKDWPSEWKDPEPRQLRVRSGEWKEVDTSFQWAFRATIPIRDPSTNRPDRMLRVVPQCHSDGEGVLSNDTRPLVWDQLRSFESMPTLDWSNKVEPDYVKEHPIGRGQTQADKLLKRLRNGDSFAMVAPRRFGKSTLIEYIAREAEQNKSGEYKLFVLKPLVCTDYHAGDRTAVWKDVHERLIQKIGVGLTTTDPGAMLSTDDIKRARTSAWKSGYRGIVLLFDEAQLFFVGRDGTTVGDKLKDALEREWTCQPEQGLASVQIGLVGLPSLLDRAGTNLMTALQVVESNKLDDDTINRLLLAVSQKRIQTTRAARQELADRTGKNLFILKTMVERIQDRLKEEKRLWFNDHDVVAAFSDARESLERGSEQGLAHYLRDSLNEAESVNEWQPKPCYPLAVALARVGRSPTDEERINLAVKEVQGWCANLPGGEGSYTSYTKERIKEDIEALRELDVYDGGFHSEVLEGYLRYVAKTFPREDDTQVMTRCGVERIREPKSLELFKEGGQAKIYRFHKDDNMWAWRQIELSDSRANELFLVTQEALHKLRDLRHETGSQSLYNLQQVGISEKGYGVEVYRWIDGVSLDDQVDTFSKEAVVDIGFKIGQAIKLIHDHDILHRDISPRNIILTDKAVPVLIDFGLARAADRKMRTRIGGEDAPPEVQSDRPDWTKAADIHGFGITLQKLLKTEKGKSDSLHDLLDRCLSRNPKQRPNAGELLNEIEEIRRHLHVQDIRDKAWRKIEEVAKQPETNPRFQDLLLKFQPQFEGIAIGLYPGMIEQCAEMSVFLDQTLEAFSDSNEGLKLGSIKGKGLRGVTMGQGIHFAHSLRLEKSHFLGTERKKKLGEFDKFDDQRKRELMIEAAEQIGQCLDLPQLVNVVEKTLRQRDT